MKKNFFKKIILCLILLSIFLPVLMVAEENSAECNNDNQGGYCFLSPIFADQVGKPVNMADYLQQIYNVFFVAAGILATLMLIIGGFQYMTSALPGVKGNAKETMQNAIWGLLLAIFSYTLLYTINPNLVNVSFSLKPITGLKPAQVATTTPTAPTPSGGGPWYDDSLTRDLMRKNIPGVVFNNNNCVAIGQESCTSVYGISSAVVSGLSSLQKACNCQLMVNGGTEYWLHGNKSTDLNLNKTAHRPGGRVVDLNDSAGLNKFIREKGTPSAASGCSNLGPKFKYNGATYVDEGNHWHVCY